MYPKLQTKGAVGYLSFEVRGKRNIRLGFRIANKDDIWRCRAIRTPLEGESFISEVRFLVLEGRCVGEALPRHSKKDRLGIRGELTPKS